MLSVITLIGYDAGCVFERSTDSLWFGLLLLLQVLGATLNPHKNSSYKCTRSSTGSATNPFTHTSPVPRTPRTSGSSSKPSKIRSSSITFITSTWNKDLVGKGGGSNLFYTRMLQHFYGHFYLECAVSHNLKDVVYLHIVKQTLCAFKCNADRRSYMRGMCLLNHLLLLKCFR